jgi:hypothetical protein
MKGFIGGIPVALLGLGMEVILLLYPKLADVSVYSRGR